MLKVILACYLIGSVPFAYICSRLFRGQDIREIGSTNVGTTNVVKNIGWIPGVITLVGDVFKGWLAGVLGVLAPVTGLHYLTPAVAIAGHNWPVWLRFRGGGGLATFVGGCLAVANWSSALLGILVWGLFYLVMRDHDRSAISACLFLPLAVFLVGQSIQMLLFFGSSSLMILLKRLQCLSDKRAAQKGEQVCSSRL